MIEPEGHFRSTGGHRAFWWFEVQSVTVEPLDWVTAKLRDGRVQRRQIRKILSRHPELGMSRVLLTPANAPPVKRVPVPT